MKIKLIAVVFVLVSVLSVSLLCSLVISLPSSYADSSTNNGGKLPGDINGDGAVNILDFVWMKLILLGKMQPNGNWDIYAQRVDSDGNLGNATPTPDVDVSLNNLARLYRKTSVISYYPCSTSRTLLSQVTSPLFSYKSR